MLTRLTRHGEATSGSGDTWCATPGVKRLRRAVIILGENANRCLISGIPVQKIASISSQIEIRTDFSIVPNVARKSAFIAIDCFRGSPQGNDPTHTQVRFLQQNSCNHFSHHLGLVEPSKGRAENASHYHHNCQGHQNMYQVLPPAKGPVRTGRRGSAVPTATSE